MKHKSVFQNLKTENLAGFLEECEEDFGQHTAGSLQAQSSNLTHPSTIVENTEVEKCASCGASRMRQNGTCMLCEVCGDTTGCS